MRKTMTRIGFDATNILGHGGIKTYARQLIRAMAAEAPGCRLLLFTTRSRSKRETLSELFSDLGNVSIHSGLPHARMLGDGLRRLTYLAGSMAWRFLAGRVDLIHLTDPYSSAGVPEKFISTIHDIFPLTRPEHAGKPLHGEYLRKTPRILARSSAVIVPSEYVSGELSRLFPEAAGKLHVVPEAVGVEFSPDGKGEVLTPYFLFVGRPDLRKNLPRLIEAFGRVRSRMPEIRLKLVLSGPTVPVEIQGDAVEGSIEVLRDVSASELVSLYSSALALVFPSLDEGFGLPVLEAMRCGCPVITSRTGSLPEVAGSAAMLIDPLDVTGISSAIADLARSADLRDRLSRKGMEQASLFTWKSVALETLRIYRRIIPE